MIASVIHFAGVIFYAIFASGEKQPWAEPEGEDSWRPEDTLKTDDYGKLQSYGSTMADRPVYETKEELVQKQSYFKQVSEDSDDQLP